MLMKTRRGLIRRRFYCFKKNFIQGNTKFTGKISHDVPPVLNELKFLQSAKAVVLQNDLF